MEKRKQKQIIFNHIELDEPVSPEFVKELHELIAKKLFETWLSERKSGIQTNNVPSRPESP